MQIPKPTDADRDRFRSLAPDDPRVEIKPMFGNLGGFVNGNMFMGLFGSDVGVKLPAARLADLLAVPGSGPFGPTERPMGGYANLPADLPAAQTRKWITEALGYVASLPPKQAKPKKPSKARS